MKIVYLITKSNYGGAQKYTTELAVAAQSRGHDVVVLAGGTGEKSAAPGIMAEKLQAAGVRFRLVRSFVRDMSLFSDVAVFFELFKKLRQEKPDVLHLSSSKAAGIGAVIAHLVQIPRVVFTVHGLPEDEAWRPWWQRFLITSLTNLTVKLVDVVITINSREDKELRTRVTNPEKVVKIFNGISPFTPLSRPEALHKMGVTVPKNAVIIGGIGELHPNKNWSVLLHTLSSLPKEVRLLIIGAGDEATQLKMTAEKLGVRERTFFAGYQKNAHSLLSAFDIFILPSKKEGLPYVLLEAGMAKLPVLASDLPGVKDVVTTGESGLIVNPSKTNLSAAILMLLRDEQMRQRFAEKLHQVVKEKFSQQTMVEKTFATYSLSKSDTSLERTDA